MDFKTVSSVDAISLMNCSFLDSNEWLFRTAMFWNILFHRSVYLEQSQKKWISSSKTLQILHSLSSSFALNIFPFQFWDVVRLF